MALAKHASFTKEEAKKNAITEMENCCAYLSIGDKRKAAISYGSASVFEEMLVDVFDLWLDEEDEHYKNMLEIWNEASKNFYKE